MSQGSISKWKSSAPSYQALEKVAEYLDVSVDYLQGKTKFKNQSEMLQHFDQVYLPSALAELVEISKNLTNEQINQLTAIARDIGDPLFKK
jgi:transcriptional regulator with XRE-family HTH domain